MCKQWNGIFNRLDLIELVTIKQRHKKGKDIFKVTHKSALDMQIPGSRVFWIKRIGDFKSRRVSRTYSALRQGLDDPCFLNLFVKSREL